MISEYMKQERDIIINHNSFVYFIHKEIFAAEYIEHTKPIHHIKVNIVRPHMILQREAKLLSPMKITEHLKNLGRQFNHKHTNRHSEIQ